MRVGVFAALVAMFIFGGSATAKEWEPIQLEDSKLDYVGDDTLISGITVAKLERIDSGRASIYSENWDFQGGFIRYDKMSLDPNVQFRPGRITKSEAAELFTAITRGEEGPKVPASDVSRSGLLHHANVEVNGVDCFVFHKSYSPGERILGAICVAPDETHDVVADLLGSIQRYGKGAFMASEVERR